MSLFHRGAAADLSRLSRQVRELSGEVSHLRAIVQHLAAAQGMPQAELEALRPPEQPFWQEARRLKAAGQQVAAIKTVREHSGMGLLEAKQAVDDL